MPEAPDFLKPFLPELERYRMDSIKITATPVEEGETLPASQSRFLGKPLLPADFPYPTGKDGQPMILWAQINFSEMPSLPGYPESGILQLFLPATDWYEMKDYRVLFHPDTDFTPRTDFSFLTEDLYEESPFYREQRLSFSRATDVGGQGDVRFDPTFNGVSYHDYEDSLTEEQQSELYKYFGAWGHKIGGYAAFTQFDPREEEADGKGDVLLLQIDSDEEIMFGDSGVAHLFIHPEYLKRRDFGKAYFHWDCC